MCGTGWATTTLAPVRRNHLPHLVMGLFTLLVAGAIALGLVLAPSTPDLVVHNGAGEVQLAGSAHIVSTSIATTKASETIRILSRDKVVVTLVRQTTNGTTRTTQTGGPEAVQSLLKPFRTLQAISGYRQVGHSNVFVARAPLSVLLSPAQATSVDPSSTVTATAQVVNGYVVYLREVLNINTRGAGTFREGGDYHVLEINGWAVPVS